MAGLPASVHFLLRAARSVGLHGALLDADALAAGVVDVDLLGVALRDDPLRAGAVVAHHVDLLLAVRVDGEARDADVVLAARHAEDDRAEAGRDVLGLEAELGRHGVEEVDVHALDGLAVGGEHLVGGVGRVGADDDLAGGLELGGDLGDKGLVDAAAGGASRQACCPRRARCDSEFEPQAERVRPAATKPETAMRDMRRMRRGPSEHWRTG